MAPKKKRSSKPREANKSSKSRNTKSTSSSPSDVDDDDAELIQKRSTSKHKSFGKFRFLTEGTSNPDSGLETECEHVLNESVVEQSMDDGALYDSLLISSDGEMNDSMPIDLDVNMEGESVEIIATEISQQLTDLHVGNDFYLNDTVTADEISCGQEVEISANNSGNDELTTSDESFRVQLYPNDQNRKKQKVRKNVKKKLTKAPKRTHSGKKSKNKKENDKSASELSENSLAYENIRRSVRIKCKETSKPEAAPKTKTKKNGKAVVDSDASNISSSSFPDSERTSDPTLSLPVSGYDTDSKPVKVKSRWRRSSELEMESLKNNGSSQIQGLSSESEKDELEDPLKTFVHLRENLYLTPKFICKEAKKMACDCVLTVEEISGGDLGCGDDCLNRLLMIECGAVCPVNERCSNKRFQKCENAPCEVFRTDRKGSGIRATADIPYGQFILEYVGEVIGPDEFEERATDYSKDKNPHHYFMALRSDAVIDATAKGNMSRFINHSCDPNAETQKWTVNGELRIGFFSKRTIIAGEEITFDYQFQRYGKDAQKCLCEAATCRGWLGAEPDEEVEEEEEEVEEEVEVVQELEKPKLELAVGEEAPSLEPEHIIEEKPPVLEMECMDEPPVVTSPDEEITMPVITPIEPVVPVEIKKIIKKEKKKIIKRKVRKEILFENVDVDGEIEMLVTSGLKNQAHTLKLSRLMVRATEVSQRSALLRILRRGELPCRRLFLDYHGLRLIYGWMNDAQQLCKADQKSESLRLELLQTLATLPIPNKTMLQESKVLSTVELWSTKLEDISSGIDSGSNSPKTEVAVSPKPDNESAEGQESHCALLVSSEFQIEIRETKDIRRSVGMDRDCRRIKNPVTRKRGKELILDIIELFEDLDDELKTKKVVKPDIDYEVEIIALAVKLLEEWAILKVVFKIPKKERIEQMKEHEREADRVYKSSLDRDRDRDRNRDRVRDRERDCEHDGRGTRLYGRFKILKKSRNGNKSDFPERNLKSSKAEDTPLTQYNRHERRKLFAMQVEQRDMWRQHELQCMSLGTDPRFTPSYDYTRNMQCVWNQQTGQWQPVGGNQNSVVNPPGLTPSRYFNFTTPPSVPTLSNMPPPSIPPVTPQINIPPSPSLNISQLALNNITRPTPVAPIQQAANLTTNLSNALANLISLTGIQQQLTSISGLSSSNSITTISQPLTTLPQSVVQATSRVPGIQTVISLPNVSQETVLEEDPSQVKFAGPIPPPVKLPPKWKCAKDKYNRPFYYHVKIRISQWEPPEFPPTPPVEYEDDSIDTSSSNTSSTSEDSITEESDADDDDDDDGLANNKLLMQIRKKIQQGISSPTPESRRSKATVHKPSLDDEIAHECLAMSKISSLDERLQLEFNLAAIEKEPRRQGLVTEIHLISPRTEEDKQLAKENLRMFKQNKQRLKRKRELEKINVTLKRHKSAVKVKVKDFMDSSSEEAKRIKEAFRSTMATYMVGILNPFRKRDCMEGKITNNEDFKHLARKLTLFVMLKQLKICDDLDELVCSDSVKSKAKVFVNKYMSKFGEVYVRPKDDAEYY